MKVLRRPLEQIRGLGFTLSISMKVLGFTRCVIIIEVFNGSQSLRASGFDNSTNGMPQPAIFDASHWPLRRKSRELCPNQR